MCVAEHNKLSTSTVVPKKIGFIMGRVFWRLKKNSVVRDMKFDDREHVRDTVYTYT